MPFATFGDTVPSTRTHIGLPVSDIERSVTFYQALLREKPTKRRAGFVRFEVADPPLNLTLHSRPGQNGPASDASHFGIQVGSSEAVRLRARQLDEAGLTPKFEEQVTCCYAVQDKAWVIDPDGNEWEVFVVTDDNAPLYEKPSREACCEDTCCSEPMV
jgi:catechol 2,3-dioxygenase-like lactoylglutathione lyase family enzyme